MALALTDYKAFAVYIDEPVTTRCIQHLTLSYTSANSDLTHDIAETTTPGTFWTAVSGTALGAAALVAVKQIQAKAFCRTSWCAPAFQDAKTPLAASGSLAATTQYQITTTSIVPSFLFYTAGAPTSVVFHLSCILNKEERGVRAGNI